MELPGLRPDDRLEDLEAEIDPLFFDELADEFGFQPPASHPEVTALAASMETVRDVVNYVTRSL